MHTHSTHLQKDIKTVQTNAAAARVAGSEINFLIRAPTGDQV